MSKVGIICEGGGTKAAYTAGVLECLMDQNIKVPYTAGISAGAMCLIPYVSNQKERLRITGVDSTTRKEAVGIYPMIHEKAVFGINATYDYIEKECPLDLKAFRESETELEMGLYNLETGELEYFNKSQYREDGSVVKAACALLILTHPVTIDGVKYMDGGLIDMIPVEAALRAGCDKVIFISTKEANYVRKPAPSYQLKLARLLYKNEPFVEKDLKVRHENYQKQWQKVKDLESQGKAIILRPSKDMGITRYTNDKDKLNQWYDLGYEDTLQQINSIREFVES
ncbi:MAG: patatin family protein [Traorella sp.]